MHTRSNRFPYALAAASLLAAACGDDHGHEDHDEGRLGRLLVADADVGTLRIVDLDEGDTIATYSVGEPARVFAGGPHHRLGYVFLPTSGTIRFIDGGVWLEDHGDHQDVRRNAPNLFDFTLEGVKPTHFAQYGARSAIFFDGAQPGVDPESPEVVARAAVLLEDDILDGQAPSVASFEDAAAHHGVAVPLLDGLLISSDAAEPTSSNPLPEGVRFLNWNGDELQTFPGECPALHGAAVVSNDRVAFGCSDGVLLVERDSHLSDWSTRKLAYPDDRRSGTLVASHGILIGNYQSDSAYELIRYDYGTEETTLISFEHPISAFEFAEGHDHPLAVLTADGTVHVVDAEDADIVASIPAVGAFPPAGSAARPRLAVSYEVAYVSDPDNGRVVEIDLDHMEVERRITVAGRPHHLVVLGPGTPLDDDDHDH